MNKTVTLEIVTPERIILTEEIQFLTVLAEKGELGILPEHTFLLAQLRPGIIRITDAHGKVKSIDSGGGFLEVHPKKVTVFAEFVTMPDWIYLKD